MVESGTPPAGVDGSLDHLFRRESGRVVATIIRIVKDFDLAEEIVQEAMLTALERWPFSGVPDNPGAWLMTTAKNRALDHLRKKQRFDAKRKAIVEHETQAKPDPLQQIEETLEPIADDQLRLIFT